MTICAQEADPSFSSRFLSWVGLLLLPGLLFSMVLLSVGCSGGDEGGSSEPEQEDTINEMKSLRLLFLGDSLTSGYKLPANQAFPALIQEQITFSGLPHSVKNSGRNGDTSADALRRIEYELDAPIDILILALGVNDVEDSLGAEQVKGNLHSIISIVREANPGLEVIVAGAYPKGFFSPQQKESYRLMYESLALAENAVYIEDMLEGVQGVSALNMGDGIHPNAAGHQRIAALFWAVLEPMLLQQPVP